MSEDHRNADSVLRDEDVPAERKGPKTDASERNGDDPIEEADLESFPASDAPGWNSGGDPVIIRHTGEARF